MCKCNKNGQTERDFLTLCPGGTPEDSTYELGLTYNTCGGRKMLLADPTHPVVADLAAKVVGTPQYLGNSAYCCEVQITGTVKFKPCGCCSPREEYVFDQFCIPCASDAVPALTLGEIVCAPQAVVYYDGCCQKTAALTSKVAITTSLNVATSASSSSN